MQKSSKASIPPKDKIISYQCDQRNCSKQFVHKQGLSLHHATVHKLLPRIGSFKCRMCPESFSLETSLVLHCQEVHSAKPYKCDQCDKNFKVKLHV